MFEGVNVSDFLDTQHIWSGTQFLSEKKGMKFGSSLTMSGTQKLLVSNENKYGSSDTSDLGYSWSELKPQIRYRYNFFKSPFLPDFGSNKGVYALFQSLFLKIRLLLMLANLCQK